MNAEIPGPAPDRPPAPTLVQLTFGVVVAVLALPLLLLPRSGAVPTFGYLAYLAFVVGTIAVLRGARDDAGAWLGRRAVRRALVVAVAATCAAILLSGGWALLIPLALLNVALGRATQRMATAPDPQVDERQEGLRNRAHRIAYLALVPVVGAVLAVADVAGPQTRAWLGSSALGFGGWVAFAELLFVLPAMTIAWLEPDHAPPERTAAPSPRTLVGLGMVVVAAATPFALTLGVVALPVQTTRSVGAPWHRDQSPVAAAATCGQFTGSARVGLVVQADIPINATACWDGRAAAEGGGMNQSDCRFASSIFVTVTTDRCSRSVGPDGTLTFTYGAAVRPMLLPFLVRHVTLELAVDRDGRVERLP